VPRFEPFPGLRYDPRFELDRLIAPPYDIVGPELRDVLARRHRANAIHIECPLDDRNLSLDRYANAAQLLAAWRAEDVLAADRRPAFYAYRMTTPEGTVTTGVIGALGCEPPGGEILPHEETIPKDTTDRLDLLRACRANLSPIWGLSLTAGLAGAIAPEGDPDGEATDDEGVLHQVWVLDHPATVEAISTAVGSSPVVIADGHHRYQTACTYQAERLAAGDGPGDQDLVMALVVELAPDQLQVGPIHRTISGLDPGVDLLEILGRFFETINAGPAEEKVVAAVAESQALALVTSEGVWLLTPRPETYEAATSELDSSLVALAVAALPGATSLHHHAWREAVDAVLSGAAQAALLLRPVTVDQISEWAEARRRMPPKSTYFHPKPRTGMVYRVLGD
jgi:uncharacterized protein (DUF1015 family)